MRLILSDLDIIFNDSIKLYIKFLFIVCDNFVKYLLLFSILAFDSLKGLSSRST